MGFLSGLFGKSKKVEAPEVKPIGIGEVFGGAMGDINSQLAGVSRQSKANFKEASKLTGDIVPLVQSLDKAPTLAGADLDEYNNAVNTFTQFLNLAKTNTINETATGMKAASSALGLKGFNTDGAGSNQILSSIGAKTQGNLNQVASETAANLLSFRSGLLNNVYQRLTNRVNGTLSAQAQLTSQGEALFSTAFNTANVERNYRTNVASQNAQMSVSAQVANNQAKQSNLTSLMSLGSSLFSSILSR